MSLHFKVYNDPMNLNSSISNSLLVKPLQEIQNTTKRKEQTNISYKPKASIRSKIERENIDPNSVLGQELFGLQSCIECGSLSSVRKQFINGKCSSCQNVFCYYCSSNANNCPKHNKQYLVQDDMKEDIKNEKTLENIKTKRRKKQKRISPSRRKYLNKGKTSTKRTLRV